MNLPDHIRSTAVDDALLNIGMTINEIRELTGDAAPQIIRTVEELEALDPDTLVMSRKGYLAHAEDNIRIPVVVVATADQVRAARKALEEE